MRVNSAIHYISRERDSHAFRATCESWVDVMRTWRQVRHLLNGRYIEVEQERIAQAPDRVGMQLAEFLRVPQSAEDLSAVFRSTRENVVNEVKVYHSGARFRPFLAIESIPLLPAKCC